MITVVTDSTSYFKKEEAERLGIRIIPNNYFINGRSYSEVYSDQNEDYEALSADNVSGEFSTAHINPADCRAVFDEEIKRGNQVFCITISSRFSGSYSTAGIAAEPYNEGEFPNVLVFDSKLTAGGLYMLVKEAKELADKGMTLSEIETELSEIRDKINIAFSVDDMTPLRNSGRLGFVRSNVGTFLNIKPILLCRDGAIESDCTVRGDREVVRYLSRKIGDSPRKAVISYVGGMQSAGDLYNVIKTNHPDAELSLQKLGPVLGIHLGNKIIAVSYMAE